MDGLPQIDRNQEVEEAAKESAVNVLPPPTEVKIRTMKSDIAGLAASGGGLPRYANVKVRGLSIDKPAAKSSEAAHKSGALTMVIVTTIVLVILIILAYFGYRIFTGGSL